MAKGSVRKKRKEMVLPLLCGGRKRKLGTERIYGNGKQERDGKAVASGNGGLPIPPFLSAHFKGTFRTFNCPFCLFYCL